MSDSVDVLLKSPRSQRAMENLGYNKEELRYLSKDEYKAKLGNMKISKDELSKKWDEYEQLRKDRIQQILEERKKFVGDGRGRQSTALTNSYSTNGLSKMSKHAHSVAYLPTLKQELIAKKQRQEFEMGRIMKQELSEMEMKKITQQKYELLLKKEREQLQFQKQQKVKKQSEMKRLHEIAEFQKLYKTEKDMLQEKLEKIAIEREIDRNRREESLKRQEEEKRRQFELKIKEQHFKIKTNAILNDQQERIEKKRESLERFLEDKEQHIQKQEVQKEQYILKKKEDKLRNIFRTLERNEYHKEKKKQDWLEKALDYEDKKHQKEIEDYYKYQRKLEESKRKEYYRENVKQRNLEMIEEKKNKTLWKLEKIQLGGEASIQRGRYNSGSRIEEDRGGQGSRASY